MDMLLEQRENEARRQLAKQGYTLRKSRSGGVIGENVLANDRGGYMIVNSAFNTIEAGERYDMSLEDVERFAAE